MSNVDETTFAPNINKDKSIILNFVSMLLVALFWGLSWPAGRVVALYIQPNIAAFLRVTIALPLFFLAAYFIEGNIKIPKEFHKQLFFLGLLQVTLYSTLFLVGLRYTSGSDASLVIATNPAITAFIASRKYEDEKLTTNKILGLLVSLGGVVIVVLFSPNTQVETRYLGNSIILFAAICWAFFTVFSRPILQKIKPIVFTAWIMFYGWIFLFIIAIIIGIEIPPLSEVAVIGSLLYMAIFAMVIAYILFNKSVGKIGPSKTAIFVNLVPIIGVTSSVLILRENFSLWYIVSLIMIFTGIYVVNSEKRTN
ncbi:MAG: DMT family transporter [Candidatus Heimdallarchaeota archaeon]|nr:DMT family transporter [Candidatus Heimdallarchaeota archaeon]MDH5645519.1 DMT family transporter [Candidatus Heimdallarchaeota archaeon]